MRFVSATGDVRGGGQGERGRNVTGARPVAGLPDGHRRRGPVGAHVRPAVLEPVRAGVRAAHDQRRDDTPRVPGRLGVRGHQDVRPGQGPGHQRVTTHRGPGRPRGRRGRGRGRLGRRVRGDRGRGPGRGPLRVPQHRADLGEDRGVLAALHTRAETRLSAAREYPGGRRAFSDFPKFSETITTIFDLNKLNN